MITLDSISAANASIEIQTAAGQALAIDGTGAITISNTSFTVTATDLDIRDLAFATDSVTAHQGGSWSFTMDNISSWKTTAETATTTASEIVATPLASRNKMIIQNLGNSDVYLGPDGTVTTGTGILLPKGSSLDYPFDDVANIFVITSSGTSDLRVLEAAA